MIKRTLAALWALAILAWAAPVFAQPVSLPANTVWGRLGIGTGPGQAIPIPTLKTLLLNGPAITTVGDMAFWNNTTGTLLGDAPFSYSATGNVSGTDTFSNNSRGGEIFNSADVTTLSNQFDFGGSATAGNTITVTLAYNNSSGIARSVPISYLVQSGDTLASITTGMKNALIAAGAVAPLSPDFAGLMGFFVPGTVGVSGTTSLRFNFYWLPGNNGTPTLTFTNNSTGGTTTTITINGSLTGTGATASNPKLTLDTVPRLFFARPNGLTRAGIAGDIIWQILSGSNTDAGLPVQYGTISFGITNPAAAAPVGNIILSAGQNSSSGYFSLGNGLFLNVLTGGAPVITYPGAKNIASVGTGDYGIHNFAMAGYFYSGMALIGPWPANANYALFGNARLDQSVSGNYALVQGLTGDTILNSATSPLQLRIANFSTASLTYAGTTNPTILGLGITGTSPGQVQLFNGTSGSTTLQPTTGPLGSGVLTLPGGTDTLVCLACTQTLTGKTYDTAGSGNVFKINGTTISAVTGTGAAVLATSPTITTPVISSIVNTGTLTLPTSTDTLIGRATTDTLTNKTFDTAGAGNVFKINGTTVSAVTGTGSTAVLSASPTFTTSVILPVINAPASLLFQTNGVTFAGYANSTQQWYLGPTNVGVNSNVVLTVSRNTAVLPAGNFTGTVLQLANADGTPTRSTQDTYAAAGNSSFSFRRSRGTAASPSAAQSTDILGAFFFEGYGNSQWSTTDAPVFAASAAELFTNTAHGTDMYVTSIPTGSLLSAEVMRWLAAGNVKFSNAASFSANASVATSLGSIGPVGSHTTVQKWLTIVDSTGATLYIPAF